MALSAWRDGWKDGRWREATDSVGWDLELVHDHGTGPRIESEE